MNSQARSRFRGSTTFAVSLQSRQIPPALPPPPKSFPVHNSVATRRQLHPAHCISPESSLHRFRLSDCDLVFAAVVNKSIQQMSQPRQLCRFPTTHCRARQITHLEFPKPKQKTNYISIKSMDFSIFHQTKITDQVVEKVNRIPEIGSVNDSDPN